MTHKVNESLVKILMSNGKLTCNESMNMIQKMTKEGKLKEEWFS